MHAQCISSVNLDTAEDLGFEHAEFLSGLQRFLKQKSPSLNERRADDGRANGHKVQAARKPTPCSRMPDWYPRDTDILD